MSNETTAQASETGKTKSFARHIPSIVRVLLGLMFLVFGLNGFLNFMPPPNDMPQKIMEDSVALMKGGYMTVVEGTEVIVAVLLLSGRFVPLALALLAPIVVGIVTFHIYLAPATIGPGVGVLVMELYLAWAYRSAFVPMLRMRVTPG